MTPRRFDTTSYLTAGDVSRPLTGTPVKARRDLALAPAMSHTGRRIEEELALDDFLSDSEA
ncbi:DUF2399 domain-containing protein [Lentzea sp. BCCO 10_0798]|uniref:DUF2399 domain-containing protein n=1 Tax=Lentzea kristufekii TaxID=3095430 RepID=A0ABU4TVY8_9PSEU|nr:DUF2399 domain-containing protein [Lentzea sp. BCCO 10_0798]MDX8052477.1 DUF2399 domain-containing protein [Lentzea sp. BCCO 10_0798]